MQVHQREIWGRGSKTRVEPAGGAAQKPSFEIQEKPFGRLAGFGGEESLAKLLVLFQKKEVPIYSSFEPLSNLIGKKNLTFLWAHFS